MTFELSPPEQSGSLGFEKQQRHNFLTFTSRHLLAALAAFLSSLAASGCESA